MNRIFTFLSIITIVLTLSSCGLKDFAMQDDWEGGEGQVEYINLTASTEMIPEFVLDDKATFFVLEPKSASIKEQKILYTLKKSFKNSNNSLIKDINKAKYVLAYSETLQKSTRMYSVPTFYSTYTNFTGFAGQNISTTSFTTGSKTQMTTNYFNVINLSLFEWKDGKLNIVWNGNTVVDTDEFKVKYTIYTELLFKLLGKETTNSTVKISVVKNQWKIESY